MYGRVFFVALGLVGAVGAAAVYGVGAQMVIDGTITVGTLVALAAYVTRLYEPLTSLTNARVDVMTALVSFERVFEVLDAPVAIEDRPGAVDLISPAGRIELDHVSFRYPPGSDVSIASLEALATATSPARLGAARAADRTSTPPSRCCTTCAHASSPARWSPWWDRPARARRRWPR